MKRSFTLIVTLCLAMYSYAQSLYTFSKSTATYTETTGGTSIIPKSYQYADTFIVPGFDVTVAGYTNDTLFIDFRGSINTYKLTEAARSFYFFYAEHMGEATYIVSGTTGNRVLILQYKNRKFPHDFTSADYMNYQVWYYETDHTIEVRFGASSVLNSDSYYQATGPGIGAKGLWLTGSPAAPVIDTTFYSHLTGTPANGTVYRFESKSTSIHNQMGNENTLAIYPNPVMEKLTIAGFTDDANYVILSVTGDVLQNGTTVMNTIDVEKLATGNYILILYSNKHSGRLHFVK